uniref:Uncharacterized protein n=1 Tax=Solanum tuberosum TaxID=4113 RepID=M1DXI1_SOLTU
MSTHSDRETEWVKVEAVLQAASGCPRGIHLKREPKEGWTNDNEANLSNETSMRSCVVPRCYIKCFLGGNQRLANKRSSRQIAEEVSDPDLDRRWTQDNFNNGVCNTREKSEYPEDMVKTNIFMPPRKRVQGITINEGGSNPLKKMLLAPSGSGSAGPSEVNRVQRPESRLMHRALMPRQME